MTTEQVKLARHALGLPNKLRTSYRNRFCAGLGHADYENWMQMVADGNAVKRESTLYGGDSMFYLTVVAARSVLLPREKLDPEDFTPRTQGRI